MLTKQSLLMGYAPGIDLPCSLLVGQSDIHFPVLLVTLVYFLTASLHWRNRWTNSVNLLTWRSGGSFQSDSMFLLKPSKLMFSLLLVKFKKVINCSACLICKAHKSAHITLLVYDLHWLPISSQIRYKIALYLLPHCLWYSSSIPLWAAPSLLLLLSLLSLGYSDLPCS